MKTRRTQATLALLAAALVGACAAPDPEPAPPPPPAPAAAPAPPPEPAAPAPVDSARPAPVASARPAPRGPALALEGRGPNDRAAAIASHVEALAAVGARVEQHAELRRVIDAARGVLLGL